MKLSALKTHIKTALSSAPECDANYETRYILEETANIDWANSITNPDQEIPSGTCDKINEIIKQRQQGKPLSRIYGLREFYGLNFNLSTETLDPRPETELIVDLALTFLKDKPNARMLDLGTGTGCIPISIAKNVPSVTGLAVDLSDNALQTAQQNAEKHQVQTRMTFRASNWFETIKNETFDLITSNPPYIDSKDIENLSESVRHFDPILALDGGPQGITPYDIIFSNLKKHLNPGGKALLEIGINQCGQIHRLAEKYRIRIKAIHPDLAGIPRVVEISCGDK